MIRFIIVTLSVLILNCQTGTLYKSQLNIKSSFKNNYKAITLPETKKIGVFLQFNIKGYSATNTNFKGYLPGFLNADFEFYGKGLFDSLKSNKILSQLRSLSKTIEFVPIDSVEEITNIEYFIVFKLDNSQSVIRHYTYGCLPLFGFYSMIINATNYSLQRRADLYFEVYKKDNKVPINSIFMGNVISKKDYGFWNSFIGLGAMSERNNTEMMQKVKKTLID